MNMIVPDANDALELLLFCSSWKEVGAELLGGTYALVQVERKAHLQINICH